MKKRLNALLAILMLVVLLGSTCVVFAEGEDLGTWETKASMPTARGYLGAASVDGKIYAIGGSNGPRLATVEEYDPLTDTWTTKADMPTPKDSFGIAEVNGKIYVIGGAVSINNNTSYTGTVEEYDPLTDTWTTKTSMPTARSGISISVLNEKIYAIGGYVFPTGKLNIVEEYDPSTDTWTTKTSMPTERCYAGTSEVDGKIYVIGGLTSTVRTDVVEEYNPLTDTWMTKTSMPTNRSHLSAEAINGKIYAIGGNKGTHLATVEEYDPSTDTWKTMASMSMGRTAFGIAEVNGEIYAIGAHIGGAINKVEAFTPPATQQTPDAPTNLAATPGDSEVALTWDSVTDATSYTVKRATTSGGPYTTIASDVTTTNYADTDVSNGTTYYYVISAICSGTESANSNEASATPEASTPVQTGSAIVVITMVNGTEKEYDLTMIEVNNFINWYEAKDNGTGDAYYIIEKTWNTGPFDSRKDYIIFDNICFFEINEY